MVASWIPDCSGVGDPPSACHHHLQRVNHAGCRPAWLTPPSVCKWMVASVCECFPLAGYCFTLWGQQGLRRRKSPDGWRALAGPKEVLARGLPRHFTTEPSVAMGVKHSCVLTQRYLHSDTDCTGGELAMLLVQWCYSILTSGTGLLRRQYCWNAALASPDKWTG